MQPYGYKGKLYSFLRNFVVVSSQRAVQRHHATKFASLLFQPVPSVCALFPPNVLYKHATLPVSALPFQPVPSFRPRFPPNVLYKLAKMSVLVHYVFKRSRPFARCFLATCRTISPHYLFCFTILLTCPYVRALFPPNVLYKFATLFSFPTLSTGPVRAFACSTQRAVKARHNVLLP